MLDFPDDPDVACCCRDTGPELGAMPRAVLRELERYGDPTTGKCVAMLLSSDSVPLIEKRICHPA